MNLSSWLKVNPYHALAMMILSKRIPFSTSIKSIVCVDWPLLVIAILFLSWLTARFKGRSPTGKFFPTGVNDQPFGNKIRRLLSDSVVCAKELLVRSTPAIKNNKALNFISFFFVAKEWMVYF